MMRGGMAKRLFRIAVPPPHLGRLSAAALSRPCSGLNRFAERDASDSRLLGIIAALPIGGQLRVRLLPKLFG
jgi:hypothetical protein